MTMSIGLQCDEGVVLVADSLMPYVDNLGEVTFGWSSDKLLWLEGSSTALVISGATDLARLRSYGVRTDYAPLSPWLPEEPDLRDRVRRTYPRIKALDAEIRAEGPIPEDEDPSGFTEDPGPHVLFALHRPGRAPELARFSSGREQWAEVGDVFTIGSWTWELPDDLREEMRRAPATLALCRLRAGEWARRFLAPLSVQEQVELCIGFPLQVIVMTDESVRHEVIPA